MVWLSPRNPIIHLAPIFLGALCLSIYFVTGVDKGELNYPAMAWPVFQCVAGVVFIMFFLRWRMIREASAMAEPDFRRLVALNYCALGATNLFCAVLGMQSNPYSLGGTREVVLPQVFFLGTLMHGIVSFGITITMPRRSD